MKILDVNDFKEQLKLVLKPIRFKAFSVGPKFTKFSFDRTGINLDKFTLGQTRDPGCLCYHISVSSEHYFA